MAAVTISDTPELAQSRARLGRVLWLVFLGAVAIRWGYDIVLFATMGRAGLMGADSYGYLVDAQTMAAASLNGTMHGWAWLGADPGVMPLYPWFLSANVALFGSLAPLTAAMVQGALDGGTCLIVYTLARSIDARIALPAAVAAAINPTQIVTSGLLYNDTIFVFFVALFLAAIGLVAAQADLAAPPLPWASGLGIAAFDRIVVAPWVPVMIIVLLATAWVMGRLRARQVGQIAAMAAIFALFVAPILARNVTQYGAWSLTSQGGAHLALWVAPLVREAKDGTPWQAGQRGDAEARARTLRRRVVQTRSLRRNTMPKSAGRSWRGSGLARIVKAWASAPRSISPRRQSSSRRRSPNCRAPASTRPRAESMIAKIGNFLFHSDNAAYAWALFIGIAGVAAIRLIQLSGFVALARDRNTWPIRIFLALWCGFILAANGPVASPKYRLPIEPVLCVLTGAGFVLLREYGRQRFRIEPRERVGRIVERKKSRDAFARAQSSITAFRRRQTGRRANGFRQRGRIMRPTTQPVSPTMRPASPTSVATGTRPALMPSAITLEKPSPKAELETTISAAA